MSEASSSPRATWAEAAGAEAVGAEAAEPESGTIDNTETAASSSGQPRALAEERVPVKLGRYEILGVLGRGGMGIVYSARDPELDRTVALKVLSAGGHNQLAGKRLLREAQTLAKIAHANVVAVYDVGEERGQLYLAMEQVRGGTLKSWLRATPRAWPSVIAMFAAAGRGLVAAHEAGLVHRDFKPDNVLIDEVGQPRVVDFGLARVVEAAREQTITSPGEVDREPERELAIGEDVTQASNRPGAPRRDDALTRPGAIMGTPAYMAPEQHLGDETDARTDQFSFCVALWEALYGERPFPGSSLVALTQAVTSGRISVGPRHGVPRAIRAALMRGLATDPRRRWPTLAELIRALEAVPRRRRASTLAAGIGTLALGLVGGTWVLAGNDEASVPATVCVDTSAHVDAVWAGPRRAAVADAITRAGGSEVGPTRELVLARLDEYGRTLAAAYEQACLDTEQRQLLSPALRDRRVGCLQARVDALAAAAALIETIERADLRQATQLVWELPAIERCADVEYLAARLAEPDDPADAAAVARARRELATANADLTAVRIDAAAAAIERASAALRGVDHPPIAVELEHARARLSALRSEYQQAADELADVYYRAFALGHDELAIDASLERITALGVDLGEPEQGLAWARQAEALIERSGSTTARADLLDARGKLLHSLEDYDRAVALFEQSLALRRREQGTQHVDVAATLNHLANALDRLGRRDEARPLLEQAIAIKLETLGEHSTSTAGSLGNLGLLLWKAGEYDEAIAHHRHALAVFERAYGPAHRSVAGTCLNLAKALHSAGRAEEALPLIERGLTIVRTAEHATPKLEVMLVNILAGANQQLGRWDAARQAYEEELALLLGMHGERAPALASALLGLAEIANATGMHRDAIDYDNRVLALQPADEPEWDQAIDAHLGLAEAWLGLDERERARTHALLARDGFAKIGGRREDERREAEAILAGLERSN